MQLDRRNSAIFDYFDETLQLNFGLKKLLVAVVSKIQNRLYSACLQEDPKELTTKIDRLPSSNSKFFAIFLEEQDKLL